MLAVFADHAAAVAGAAVIDAMFDGKIRTFIATRP